MNKRHQRDGYRQILRASRARFNQARQTTEEMAMLFKVPFDDKAGAALDQDCYAVRLVHLREVEE